jgi:hypothetical protein
MLTETNFKLNRQMVVILNGGEAGVRDLTSEEIFDDVDGNPHAACCEDVLSTASVRMTS